MRSRTEDYLNKILKEFINLFLFFSYLVTVQVARKQDMSFIQDGKMLYWALGILAITPLVIFIKEKLAQQSAQETAVIKNDTTVADELVINHKRGTKFSSVIVLGIMSVFLAALFWALRTYSTGSVFLDYVSFGAQCLIVPLIGILTIAFFCSLVTLRDNEPFAVLTADGIRVKNFGFVPWGDVEDIFLYRVQNTPMESVALRVYDLSKVSQQATLNGKLGIFWSKLFKYPPIILFDVDCENDEILRFAHQYVEPKETATQSQSPTNTETKPADVVELLVLTVGMTLMLQLFGFPFVQIMWINFLTGPAYIFLRQRYRSE